MVLLTIIAVIVGGHVTPPAVWWGSLCGFSQAFGVWWFYAALGTGPISVVSPLTAVLVAGVPVGVGLLLGERPAGVAGVGIVLALVAVLLVSREVRDEVPHPQTTPHRFTAKVAWLTVGSGLAFGMNFVVIAQAPVEAHIWPLVFARVSASTVVVVIALITGNFAAPTGVPLRLALTAGVLDTMSNIAMWLAVHASLLSLAGVLMSLYPAATVALAMVVLKERVTRWQAIGMLLAMTSVGLIVSG
jgi:drug/metabolite transporter (DMT)-like permease